MQRYIRVIVAAIISVSTILIAPVSHATGEFEFLWPTPAIAADPIKSGYPQWTSGNGQYVAMSIRDRVNLNPQSWLLNRATGESELLEANQHSSSNTQLSEDLRYMVYWKQVGFNDVRFTVKDRTTGVEVELGINPVTGVNESQTSGALQRVISKDGTKIVFAATNFQNLPNVPTGSIHIYVYDTQTQTYTLVDDPSTPQAMYAVISGDGRYVMYEKFDIATQQGGRIMYRHDLTTGEVVAVGSGSFCYGGRQILSDDGSLAAYNCRHGSKLVDMNTKETFPLESSGYVRSISGDNSLFLVGNRLYLWETKDWRVVSDDKDFDALRMSSDGKKLVGTHWVFLPDGIGHTYRPVMKNAPSFDETPPVIEPHLSAPPDTNGWNSAPVTLTWSVSDPDSDVNHTSGCDPVIAQATTSTTFTCTATSGGGTATRAITVKVDVTPPVVTPHLSPAPNSSGWNNGPVTLTWESNDPESPITHTSNCDPVAVSADTASAVVTCTAVSAGGTVSQSATVRLDTTAPTISVPTMSGGITLPLFGTIFTASTTTINATVADGLAGIAKAEYFFDTDPGQGSGMPLSVVNGAATATASLLGMNGQHALHVRTQDYAGNWSSLQSLAFRRIGQ